MQEMKYKRILIKISGEALAGTQKKGIDFNVLNSLCEVIKSCSLSGVEIAVVIGGGNFWRGAGERGCLIQRTRSDHMGMLATAMNSIALADALEKCGVNAKVLSAIEISGVAEKYNRVNANTYLLNKDVLIFAAGTGCPYFSTDTAAVLRALELDVDVILLAKNVDGVYDKDPIRYNDAKKYTRLTYSKMLEDELRVMDLTASALAMENNISILVFALSDPKNIYRVLSGEAIGTLLSK